MNNNDPYLGQKYIAPNKQTYMKHKLKQANSQLHENQYFIC